MGRPDVDGVAVEDPGEALGDDAARAAGLDNQGGVLTGGAAAEVAAPDHDITGFYFLYKFLVDILHAVRRQRGEIGYV